MVPPRLKTFCGWCDSTPKDGELSEWQCSYSPENPPCCCTLRTRTTCLPNRSRSSANSSDELARKVRRLAPPAQQATIHDSRPSRLFEHAFATHSDSSDRAGSCPTPGVFRTGFVSLVREKVSLSPTFSGYTGCLRAITADQPAAIVYVWAAFEGCETSSVAFLVAAAALESM